MVEEHKNYHGKYFLTLIFASLFLVSLGMISHNAFAMGPSNPASCNNEYEGSITNATITVGSQMYYPMKNNVYFQLSNDKSYYLTFTIKTPAQDYQGNSLPGTIWMGTTVGGYIQFTCWGTAYPNQNFTFSGNYGFSHMFNPQANLNQTVAWVTNKTSFSYTVYWVTPTQSSAPSATTLTLNPITAVPWSTNVMVSGQLTASGTGVGGKTISFSGTGASGLSPVTTNPDGTFSVTGASPSTVSTGWQVNANFAGDSTYSSSSVTSSYNTLKHNVSLTLIISPSSVAASGTYSVSGTLTDTTTGTTLSSKTISFTATSPITIPSTTTSSTGKYLVSGLTAPGTAGSYSIQAQFNGGSFYKTYSVTRTLSVT